MFKDTARFAAKKLIFSCVLLTVLLICLFSCKMFSGGDDYPNTDNPSTDVFYSPDERFVTVYFDGNAPPSQLGRALTLKNAKQTVNYFEVVFRYRESGSVYINSSVDWAAGNSVGISGVYRTNTGIDYSHATATPLVGEGSALLFAGKREGDNRTLLAVGKIIKVNDQPVSNLGGAIITTGTTSVTFELAAIKAGTSNTDIADSSFFTNAANPGGNPSRADTFLVPSYPVAAKDFPLYRFDTPAGPLDRIVRGVYEFGIDTVGPTQFSEYQDGIICAGAGSVYPAHPQYSQGDSAVTTGSLKIDTTTVVTMLNNTASGVRVENPQFEFNIDHTDTNAGRVFAFGFEIPVRNLTTSETKIWHLRPSSYENREYLDDGRGGTGGTVLVGIGEADDYTGFKLVVNSPPHKLIYNINVGWNFDINGLALAFLRRDDSFVGIVSPFSPLVSYQMVATPDNIPLTLNPVSSIPSGSTGVRTILVTYISGGLHYTAEFTILCANVPNVEVDSSGTIVGANIKSIGDFSHLSSLINGLTISGTHIWLLTRDLDISGILGTLGVGSDALLIIMAANDSIKLTRSSQSSFTVNTNANNLTIYFGRWPFSNYAIIDGYLYPTSSFKIDAGGTTVTTPATTYNTPLFTTSGPNRFVQVSPDMEIYNVENSSNVGLLVTTYDYAADGRDKDSPRPQHPQ